MKKIIYVATYTTDSGYGSQKVFSNRKAAKDWLFRKYKSEHGTYSETLELDFKEWCHYGAWTSTIKKHTIEE